MPVAADDAARREKHRIYMREYVKRPHIAERKLAQRAERNERRRAAYAADAAIRKRKVDENRQWRLRNPEAHFAQRLKPYGITPDEYRAILEIQGGGCDICGRTTARGRGRFHIDHCHETNTVRGILCSDCNLGLGKFEDDPERLEHAAVYLRTTQRAKT